MIIASSEGKSNLSTRIANLEIIRRNYIITQNCQAKEES